ncbi:MAG: hypothetical protein GXY77_18655 [Fibrobacter sp.]|nr:hypothetical protein [Fibrobacter sp.]
MNRLFSIQKKGLIIPLILTLLVTVALVFISCSGESDEKAREKLKVILNDDLKAIIEGIDSKNLIDEPYYDLVRYQNYDEGNYSKRAVVDFYFLKDVNVKIIRKYRYHRVHRMWDRYFNEYSFLSDTSDTNQKK